METAPGGPYLPSADGVSLRLLSAVISPARWTCRIDLNPGGYRNIRLLREGTPVFDPDRLPAVAAGTPTLADESKAVMRVPDER